MNYAIVAPELVTTSAGIRGLYRLNSDLRFFNQKSRIIVPGRAHPPVSDNEIVIYPDCIVGNPYAAKNVVRYLMMFAGYFGQDKDFPPEEYMYYYTPEFCLNGREPDNILTIPMMQESRFPYVDSENRIGSCYLAIKYQNYFGFDVFDVPPDAVRIDVHTDLAALFSKVKKLITFDNSLINLEAAFAGVTIEYRFNEKFKALFSFGGYFDYADVRRSYLGMKRRYIQHQLSTFIKRTQERFRDESMS